MVVAAALASGDKVMGAAAKAQVTDRTVYRWLEEDDFVREIAAMRAAMFTRGLGSLADGCWEATVTLRLICNNKNILAATRVQAARAILEFGVKFRDSLDLERRLAQLERLAREEAQENPENPGTAPDA